MNTRKALVLLAFVSVVLLPFSSAQAAKTEPVGSRYFVHSTSSLWKNSFNARHVFDDGFTADLTDWQLRVAKVFGIQVEPVSKLFILPGVVVDTEDPTPTPSKPGGALTATLSDSFLWGVAAVGLPTKESTGTDVRVAVLDTGVLAEHPDLKGQIEDCLDFTNNKMAIVANSCGDRNGHGTHVAGIIAADGGARGTGLVGVAPQAKVLAYRVCAADGVCLADDVAMAIRVAVESKAHIINISLGSDTKSPLIASEIAKAIEAGLLVIASAGNDGPYTGSIDYPAAYPNVISVGALDNENTVPDWSSRGTEFVAPGVNIQSTWNDGKYAVLSGTSVAAPHISGLAARLWDLKSKHPAKDVQSILQHLATDVAPDGLDEASGLGFPHLP